MVSGDFFRFLLGTLAVWRVTHLITYEDGPWEILVRFRRSIGSGFWGSLVDCFYCLSLWVAAPVALIFRPSPAGFPLFWLALSGAACLLERFAPDHIAIQPLESAKGDPHDVVLREEQGNLAESAGIHHGERSA